MKKVDENMPGDNAEAEREYRDRIDLLRSRVGLLKGKDKTLMTMYIENGNSFRQMARLAGVNEMSIARRIHKVTERLVSGGYITCLQNRSRFRGKELDIAKDYFVYGLSMRKIAGKYHCTYYSVRKVLKKIQGIIALPETKTAACA
jgi:predicted DNA-binding protein YlxM (UPF0122 family)